MYTSIHIKNFRGIEALPVDDLGRINLLVGKNNTGKTSVLEALLLLGWPTKPWTTLTLGTMRGQRLAGDRPDAIWRALFHRMDLSRAIELTARDDRQAGERKLSIQAGLWEGLSLDHEDALRTVMEDDRSVGTIRYRHEPSVGAVIETEVHVDPSSQKLKRGPSPAREDAIPTVLLSARSNVSLPLDIQRYSDLLKTKQESSTLEALRMIEPQLQRLELISEAGEPTVYADIGLPALVPLAICGEGMVRMFSIIVELSSSRGGVLLVDEIDNGLHHSVMSPFWTALATIAKDLDVQIFATTHNDEIIRAALDAFSHDLSVLRIFRLDRRGDAIHAVRYSDLALQGIADHDADDEPPRAVFASVWRRS